MPREKMSFIQFYKKLKERNITSIKELKRLIGLLHLEEQDELEYESYPVEVLAGQIPIVVGEPLIVKVVALIQGEDKIAVIVPEGVAKAYKDIIEEGKEIKDVNVNFTLLTDLIGFDTNSSELKELIKNAYLSSLNYAQAFDTTSALPKKEEPKEELDRDRGRPIDRPLGGERPAPTFRGAEVPNDDTAIDGVGEFEENKKAFSKFKKQTTKLENLIEHIENISPKALLENIEMKFVNNTLLYIFVDNKTLVESLDIVPNYSKSLLSGLGENIKQFDGVQLVDTAPYKNGRVFIVAESVGNNYWLTEDDDIKFTRNTKNLVLATDDNMIILKKSAVRMDERKYIPFIDGKDILFKKK